MQTGIDRRQIILITAGVLVTALVVWCVYLFIFGNSQVSVGTISKTKPIRSELGEFRPLFRRFTSDLSAVRRRFFWKNVPKRSCTF